MRGPHSKSLIEIDRLEWFPFTRIFPSLDASFETSMIYNSTICRTSSRFRYYTARKSLTTLLVTKSASAPELSLIVFLSLLIRLYRLGNVYRVPWRVLLPWFSRYRPCCVACSEKHHFRVKILHVANLFVLKSIYLVPLEKLQNRSF